MKIIICKPELTMKNTENADRFFYACQEILDTYVLNRQYVSTLYQINQLSVGSADADDIFVFFNSEDGSYDERFLRLLRKYNDAQSRIWAIAMERNPECRRPPKPISDRQSFDVFCRNENRSPMKNNMKAIAQLFARKVIAQTLSPLYRDEVFYFISHRRSDGEHIAAKLSDELRLLTRERNVYRDVVRVEVGKDAQKDIDEKLALSDVLIFLQTEEAQKSSYIMKELCHALINDIPILWIQIDHASYSEMPIHPGEGPVLCYESKEFDSQERLMEIVDEVEEKCFELIMNSSNQVYSYIECLKDLNDLNKIKLTGDHNSTLAYQIEYKEKVRDRYNDGVRRHYIQCFGRNPKEEDIIRFAEKIQKEEIHTKSDSLFLLSGHGRKNRKIGDVEIIEDNYDDYIMNLENISGIKREKRNKRIILSGAFPDCDEIYKNSLLEAVVVYAREIIKNGYTLVFGAHPTFQKLIFDIGDLYTEDVKYSIEMHMDRTYIHEYDQKEIEKMYTHIVRWFTENAGNNDLQGKE